MEDFVRRFGPVVAKRVVYSPPIGDKTSKKVLVPHRLMAQDMQELRSERVIYHAALSLVTRLGEPDYDNQLARGLIREIAVHISDWPRQWDRERSQCLSEPLWKPRAESLERIEKLSLLTKPDWLLPPRLDGRIVICELLNCFRGVVSKSRRDAW